MKETPIPIGTAWRRYVVQVFFLMTCYVVVLCISLTLIPGISHRWLQVLIALAPVVPIALLLGSIIRLISRVDEMCRRIHLEAGAMAAGVTALLGLTCGFLQNVGMPKLSGFWTFVVICALYGVFGALLQRRYR